MRCAAYCDSGAGERGQKKKDLRRCPRSSIGLACSLGSKYPHMDTESQALACSICVPDSCADGANLRRSAWCARQSAAVFNVTNTTNVKSGEPSNMTTQPPNSTVICNTITRP